MKKLNKKNKPSLGEILIQGLQEALLHQQGKIKLRQTSFVIEDIKPAQTAWEVDNRIEQWHKSKKQSLSLAQYLGWTDTQYAKWVKTNKIPKRSRA